MGSIWDRMNRNGINNNFKYLFESLGAVNNIYDESKSTLSKAEDVLNASVKINNENVSVQNQINDLILMNGSSDAEVIQARIATDESFTVLKERLDKRDKNLLSRGANVYDFGAMGDNQSDDTQAILDFLNHSSRNKYLAEGTYRVTSPISIIADEISLSGPGKIVMDSEKEVSHILRIVGNFNNVSVEVDGNNVASTGIEVEGSEIDVKGCIVSNILSSSAMAKGISAYPKGNVNIKGNSIRKIISTGDSTFGNANGAARGVYVNFTEDSTDTVAVSDNYIYDVGGEEGDAIHLISSDIKFKTLIYDNTVMNFSRRAIKIQHSGVSAWDNTIIEVDVDPTNAVRAIDIIGDNDIEIYRNFIDVENFSILGINGVSGKYCKNIIFKDNTIKLRKDINISYFQYVDGLILKGNSIIGGKEISGAFVNYSVVSDNHFFGRISKTDVSEYLRFLDSCKSVITKDNTLKSHPNQNFVRNNSVQGISENNIIMKVE